MVLLPLRKVLVAAHGWTIFPWVVGGTDVAATPTDGKVVRYYSVLPLLSCHAAPNNEASYSLDESHPFLYGEAFIET